MHISINNHSKKAIAKKFIRKILFLRPICNEDKKIKKSFKAVKNIRVNINQHCELTMINAQYSCKVVEGSTFLLLFHHYIDSFMTAFYKVVRLESMDGCPIQPGSTMNRTFVLKPLAQVEPVVGTDKTGKVSSCRAVFFYNLILSNLCAFFRTALAPAVFASMPP